MDVFVFVPDVDTLVASMNAATRPTLAAAGVLGFLGVALGAFGAHALKETLTSAGTLAIWQTAVQYQLLHAVALLALAGRNDATAIGRAIAGCWIGGVGLFSGSLYGLALGGPRLLGPVTPFGGFLLLVGWALVVVAAWRQGMAETPAAKAPVDSL